MPIRKIGPDFFEQMPVYDPRVKIERMLKPFEEYQKRRDQALTKLRPPFVDEEESEVCWGQPGNFSFDDIPAVGITYSTFSTKDDKKKEKDKSVLQWGEFARKTKKIRVENPDDARQYVIVERIESIVFTAPGEDPKNWANRQHKFTLNHPK